jgi:DNA-binding winged helix-turn-helix (wHTH) protein/TolB-like protein/Flp pilus assembly protein TadD
MIEPNSSAFLFDDVRVEPETFQAFKAGSAIPLEPKTLRLLLFLIENRGRLIEKEEILNAIWNGTHVTENALVGEIAKLRKMLGDDPKAARYIQTVHTRGYRFIAEVQIANGNGTNGNTDDPIDLAAEDQVNVFRQATVVVTSASVAPVRRTDSEKSPPVPRSRIALVFTGVLGLSILVGVTLWERRAVTKLPASPSATTSVAVLPFKSLGSKEGDEYLGTEIADALTAKLSNSKRLSVRSTANVLRYATSNQDPRTIGTLLQADYVLYGEIDTSGQQTTTHLIRVRDGASLLAENYNEKFSDIFQLEDSLCAKVLGNLLVTLDHEETQRLRKRYTENQQAYETFLKAHYFMNKATKDDTNRGVDYFRQAIDLDPKYAMAYAGLSDCYMRLGRFGSPPSEFVPRSRAAVMRALELDETVAYAHSMLGRIAFQYDWDFSRAEREYARARELEPTLVHSWYGAYLMSLNRVAEAEAEDEKFEQFLPFTPGGLAQHFYLTGRYDRAVDITNKKLEANPGYPLLHEWLGLAYEQQGRSGQAAEEFQKAIDLSDGNVGVGALGHLYAASGRRVEAQKAIQRLDLESKRSYISPYQKAVIYAGLGQRDEALKLIEQAFNERSLQATSLRFDPRLKDLRAEPRFQDFVRRTGLPALP